MVHKKLLGELCALGEQLIVALNKDKQRNKKSRNKKYRAKRIAEATQLWDEYNKKLIDLKSVVKQDEPCVQDAVSKYAAIYKEYTDRLLAINDDPSDVSESESEESDSNIVALMAVQRNRFLAIRRIISDVEFKQDHNEVPSEAYINVKKQRINDLWKKIADDDEHIEITEEMYKNEVSDIETLVEAALVFLQSHLPQSNASKHEGLKLNRVEIPKFGGDYFEWFPFYNMFDELVIQNKTMPKSQKMQLLKTHVKDEAEKLIRDLTISAANFDGAWQRLMGRYNNNRVVVYKLINKLINQNNSKGDAKSVKSILDTTDQILLALQNMGRPVTQWDDWLIVVITQKMSEETHKDWERAVGNSTALPQWDQLKVFLEEQFRMLERLEGNHKRTENKSGNGGKQLKVFQTSVESACVICAEQHSLYNCPKWKQMSPKDRMTLVKKQKWCKRCLRTHTDGLDKPKCDKVCKKCKKGHSTWLHENRTETGTSLTAAHGTFTTVPYDVLLATALIKTHDINGQTVLLRVLLDSGSEGSLITEHAASRLHLKTWKSNRWIQGLTGQNSEPLKKIHLKIQPRFDSQFSLNLDFYILKNLTKMLPGHDLNTTSWKHIQKLVWADPRFYKKGAIDALLGMDAIVEIMQSGLIKGVTGQPMAQETHLGWVMSGKIDPTYPTDGLKCFITTISQTENDLRRFWEFEELNPQRSLTVDEIECEQFYQETHRKDINHRFIVKIPFKRGHHGPERLGESKGQAIARFLQIERRLSRDTKLGDEYRKVIQEYIDLGHMKEVTNLSKEDKLYYIPHHAVLKPDSLTTKVRVVFDASAKTTTGWSLNECMHTGARQQKDLTDIMLKWRLNKFVFKADVEKMYRMIQLDNEDQRYHTIVWRNSPSEMLKEYQLTTATFGTAAAPFMATRTLVQIAEDQKDTYPLAAACLKDDFYVDDLIGGSNSIEDAIKCKDELITALGTNHFSLRKWTSNCSAFLESLPPEMTEKSLQTFSEDDTTKALGLFWNPQTDNFTFKVNWIKESTTCWTKRQFLSETSKLFDPLGWLAPITINVKIMMQEIWESKIGWDDIIPKHIGEKWTQFRQEFHELEKIMIHRWIGYETGSEISLHGFSDASEKAYSAVIYARVRSGSEITTQLITAKTRVAPVNSKVSLPRLELCGAVLTSNLMSVVKKALKLSETATFLWTDSMITLGWIRQEPNKWKTFVANRVAEIQSGNNKEWNYVPTDQNPADCASRGLMPTELLSHSLWWNGPQWLREEAHHWPNADIPDHDLEQKRTMLVNLVQLTTNSTVDRVSSWSKLKRIAAYCRRWKSKVTGPLSVRELKEAEIGIIKRCQEESFPHDIHDLLENHPISSKSKLKSLNVFLDNHGILRVGGRLANAKIPYATRHPIVLPTGRHVTKLIIHQMHLDTLHGGPQLMKGLLARKYWILQSKRMVHNAYSACIICRKLKGEAYKQQMGDLPEARVTFERVFCHTGVDYAGPIEVKSSNLRSARIQKGYVAVYVCMSTKAVHLELVSDQSSEAFLASFNRFTSRRGLPTAMYSDNGTNFVGGSNKLDRLFFHQQNQAIATVVVNRQVEWKFIPPGAPNFGGLWERSVRSMKDHIKRTLKTARLTFEEYATLLCQVEACMNSRPLCSISDDIEQLDALTPGHFLIGNALLAPPQPNVGIQVTNNRNRWTYVQVLQRQLWDRWNKEYLLELQQRHKWQETSENARSGDLVAVKDEDLAPRNWLIGRIEDIHTGTDGKVRVATIRVPAKEKPKSSMDKLLRPTKRTKIAVTTDGQRDLTKEKPMASKLIKRPIRKLCPLITNANEIEMTAFHQQQVSKQTKPPAKKHSYNFRQRTTALLAVALFFFGCFVGSSATNDCIETKAFDYNAGIYFENLGKASMKKSEWKIWIYFDLYNFNQELKMLNSTIINLDELCRTSEKSLSEGSSGQCSHTVALLKSQFDEVIEMNVLLKNNKQVTTHRTKRAAPFNGIGWIGHELFGIMDASTAEKVEQKIEDCKENYEVLQQLMDQQTSVIELTTNLLKDSIEVSERKFSTLVTAIQQLNNETDLYRKRERIIGWALYTSLVINRVEKTQRNMINMLTDLQQGHVSSYLFTPKQFKVELEQINDRIPTGQRLPVSPQHDMRSFYEIMQGKMRVTEANILLEVILPLTSIEDYQVFRLIPIPIQHNNEHISIIPESKYLLITLKRNLFYQMDEWEINNCIKPQRVPNICTPTRPMNSIESPKSKCERELLVGKREINNCRIQVNAMDETWIQLKTENKWIYNLPTPTILNIVQQTNAATMTTTLHGSGILSIQPGCEVSHNGVTISSQSQISTNGTLDFEPMINLSDFIQLNGTELNIQNLTVDNSVQFKEINSKILQIHDLRNSAHTRYHTQNLVHYSITSLLITIGIILLVWKNRHVIQQRITQHRHRQVSPQHGERQLPISVDHLSSTKVEQLTDSVDSIITENYNTDDRHGPGGCPFRT